MIRQSFVRQASDIAINAFLVVITLATDRHRVPALEPTFIAMASRAPRGQRQSLAAAVLTSVIPSMSAGIHIVYGLPAERGSCSTVVWLDAEDVWRAERSCRTGSLNGVRPMQSRDGPRRA